MTAVEADAGGQEYVTDVATCGASSRSRASPGSASVAALNGFAPPPAEDFDYCELGSGNGDTTATLAAACPRARFVGVDINPEHVAFARGLARRGGLGNVRFLERDFEALARDALPDFDFVTAHGLLSWISPAKRRALIAFAAAKLKPGGLLYVSYNALPGWAAVEPLRRLMLESSAGVAGSSLERARRGRRPRGCSSDAGAGVLHEQPGGAVDARDDEEDRALVRRARVLPRPLARRCTSPTSRRRWPRATSTSSASSRSTSTTATSPSRPRSSPSSPA